MKLENDFSFVYIKHRSWIWKSIEMVLFTLLILFVSQYCRPQDPFFLNAVVPWLILLPVFCSLFYGAIYGVGSLIIVLSLLFYQYSVNVFNDLLMLHYTAGSIAFTLLTGLFSSYWISRILHVEHLNHYVWQHLEGLSKDYYLQRLSYERLEAAYILKPLSIRDVFYRIGQKMRENNGEINQLTGETVLGIFSQYCSINNAALCLFDDDLKTLTPLAFLGKNFSVVLDDPLIQNVFEEKSSHYVAVNRFRENHQTHYIAAIPLLDPKQKVIGLVVIKDMPFWCLNDDTLEALSVFAAYFSMQWSRFQENQLLLNVFPECPALFIEEFQTLVYLKKRFAVDHALACIIVPPGKQQRHMVFALNQTKRTLDQQWVHPMGSTQAVIVLMPFTGLEGLAGFKNRIEELLKNDFGKGLKSSGITYRSGILTKEDVQTQLDDFLLDIHHAIA